MAKFQLVLMMALLAATCMAQQATTFHSPHRHPCHHLTRHGPRPSTQKDRPAPATITIPTPVSAPGPAPTAAAPTPSAAAPTLAMASPPAPVAGVPPGTQLPVNPPLMSPQKAPSGAVSFSGSAVTGVAIFDVFVAVLGFERVFNSFDFVCYTN